MLLRDCYVVVLRFVWTSVRHREHGDVCLQLWWCLLCTCVYWLSGTVCCSCLSTLYLRLMAFGYSPCRVLSLSDRRYSLNPLSQTRIDWV